MNILEEAKKIIKTKTIAVEDLSEQLDQSFVDVVKAIHESQGKVVVTGVGKSGHVGEKMAATLSSTGTPPLPAQHRRSTRRPGHGRKKGHRNPDIQQWRDQGGAEPATVTQHHRSIKIAITSRSDSTLAKHCDYTLAYCYPTEADHLNLAPTTSSTLTLALGDALAGTLS